MRRASGMSALLLVFASISGLVIPLHMNAGIFGLFGGGKQQQPPGWMLHKQNVALDASAFKGAEQPCENWSWVAGITDMAAAGGAHISQQYLVDRLYGGSVCLQSAGDLEAMAQKISHDYVLVDGQRFRLDAQFSPGLPAQADSLIVSIRQSRPMMLLWRHRPYLLIGMNYDEYIAPTGNKMFIVTELKLFDPIAEEGKREQLFSRDRDDPNDLNGFLYLFIYPK